MAHALPIDDAISGQTPEEVPNAVDGAVRALVYSCSNAGTLDQTIECVFLQRGFHFEGQRGSHRTYRETARRGRS
jgi:hypothetical protein